MEPKQEGWQLVCEVCRQGWPEESSMALVAEHWNTHTGKTFMTSAGIAAVAQENEPMLELVWLGPGPAPARLLRD